MRAAALSGALVLAVSALACGGAAGVPGSFRLEAAAEVTNPGEEPVASALTWWFEPPGRWRWEIANDAGVTIGVSDGKRWWLYTPTEQTYTSQPAPAGSDQPFLPVSLRSARRCGPASPNSSTPSPPKPAAGPDGRAGSRSWAATP